MRLVNSRSYFLCEMFGWILFFRRFNIRRYYFPSEVFMWQELARANSPVFARVCIFNFFWFCSGKQALFLLCFLLEIGLLTDHSIASSKNPADGRENVTLITKKEQTYAKAKRKSFSPIAGRDSQLCRGSVVAAMQLQLQQPALQKRCPKPGHLLIQDMGNEEPAPGGKDRIAPWCLIPDGGCWLPDEWGHERFMFLLGEIYVSP